ncbi:MAG: NCS2 family permease [Candidatus Micrarchaeota archaeon]
MNVKDEFIAALTVFFASSYILFINPQILAEAGMDFDGAFFATTLSAALGTLILGLLANKPYLIAPGMMLSIFFTSTMIKTFGISWQISLAASFFVGVILLVLSLSKIRIWFAEAIPLSLRYGILGGVGLLLITVGFKNAGLIIPTEFTEPVVGSIFGTGALLAIFGFFITSLFFIKKIKGAFLIGILFTTILAIIISVYGGHSPELVILGLPKNLDAVALKYDIPGLLNSNFISIILALFMVTFFDTLGTSTALLIRGKYINRKKGYVRDLDKVMLGDSIATIFGSVLGSSPQIVYAESASAYEAGGKTGLTSVFICIFFILSLFFLPFIKIVPIEATASVIIIVGLLMLEGMKKIDLRDYSENIPAFFCLAAIPITFSISHGIGLAAILYVMLKIFSGRIDEIHLGMWITTALFLLDFSGLLNMLILLIH